MKASELRVGNVLNYDTAEGDVLPSVIDWQDIKWISEDPKGFNAVHSPTPFTEEWAEKCGFEKSKTHRTGYLLRIENSDAYFYFDTRVGVLRLYSGNGIGTCVVVKEIHFVHHLQNVFQDLRGQELTIKEAAR